MTLNEYYRVYPNSTLNACNKEKEVLERITTHSGITMDLVNTKTNEVIAMGVSFSRAMDWCFK